MRRNADNHVRLKGVGFVSRILILGGTIVDGTGRPGYRADLEIADDKIVFLGTATDAMRQAADTIIRAEGKVVSPGFIDCHTHSDLSLFTAPEAAARLYGGVTTEIAGNCGVGVAPIAEEYREDLKKYFLSMFPIQNPLNRPVFAWNTFGEYLDCLAQYPAAINVGSLVSQGAVRLAVKGFQKGKADADELRRMQALVSEAMEAGAFGISSGLNYLPGAFCDRDELAETAKPVSAYGGMYVSHIRTQSDGIFDALEEAFSIARDAGVGMHISHLKLLGSSVWGKTDELFAKIEAARAGGLPVSFDAYPYEAGATGLTALLPHWAMEGGIPAMLERLSDPAARDRIREDCIRGLPGWQALIKAVGFAHITISDLPDGKNRQLIGKTLSETAALLEKDPFDALFDLLLEEKGNASMVITHMSPADVDAIIAHPDCMIESDSTSAVSGKPHPRFYGTNGCVFRTYVRQKQLLTLEDAVRKMTGLPAEQFGISRRGKLCEGYFADVLVFDPQTIGDLATYEDPVQYSQGMDTVIVNGQIAFSEGKPTGILAGRVLRRTD